MKDEIIAYREMCDRENMQTMQRGMNFRLNARYSVLLMSQRSNAPYKDEIYPDGFTIEYEGHDVPKSIHVLNPKIVDQPLTTKTGKFTQNGMFVDSIEMFKNKNDLPELVKIYEKIFSGIWSDRGFFKLIDYKVVRCDSRKVFRFILEETAVDYKNDKIVEDRNKPRTRIIPSAVKKVVWERDEGKCVLCGANEELHFDHDLPYSKGGTSISPENVRILCARHNLQKSNKIQ